MEITIRGIGVAPGIAIGHALPIGMHTIDVPKFQVRDKDQELARFDQAVSEVREEINALHARTVDALGSQHADIFQAHLMLLEDVALREEVEERLKQEAWNAEYLVDDLIKRYSQLLTSVKDPRFRERAEDLVDIGKRILGKLLHTESVNLEHLDAPSILVAHLLGPADIVRIDKVNTLGLALEVSGATSHTAILARAFEIPTVVGLQLANTSIIMGETIVLDGINGNIVLHPVHATLQRYRMLQQEEDRERRALQTIRAEPGTTMDGHHIGTMVNIELPEELTVRVRKWAQGVGLFRTEYIFLDRETTPTEEEQFEAYRQVTEIMNPAPVIIRTLDVGGDKIAPHLYPEREANPQLGWRAIRFCLDQPELFRTHLRAMLRASVYGNLQIMFPLIGDLDQFRSVRRFLHDVMAGLEREGVAFRKDVKIGTMIEVPAAVEVAEELARECDFFSIGTNDLIQYSLAVDRVNEHIAHMYQPVHPAVIRMIRRTVKAAKAANIPCSLCGEMAGEPLYTELLLGLELDSISMSPISLPRVSAELANLKYSKAKWLAGKALRMQSAQDIESMIEKRFIQRKTMENLLKSFEQQRERHGNADQPPDNDEGASGPFVSAGGF